MGGTAGALRGAGVSGGAAAEDAAQAGAGVARMPSPPPPPLDTPVLTIQDAVLCSEMGVHFSPCGRYLAACVACRVRHCVQVRGMV